jgi:hypothetical protein
LAKTLPWKAQSSDGARIPRAHAASEQLKISPAATTARTIFHHEIERTLVPRSLHARPLYNGGA